MKYFKTPHNQSLPGGQKGSGAATIIQVGDGGTKGLGFS